MSAPPQFLRGKTSIWNSNRLFCWQRRKIKEVVKKLRWLVIWRHKCMRQEVCTVANEDTWFCTSAMMAMQINAFINTDPFPINAIKLLPLKDPDPERYCHGAFRAKVKVLIRWKINRIKRVRSTAFCAEFIQWGTAIFYPAAAERAMIVIYWKLLHEATSWVVRSSLSSF